MNVENINIQDFIKILNTLEVEGSSHFSMRIEEEGRKITLLSYRKLLDAPKETKDSIKIKDAQV